MDNENSTRPDSAQFVIGRTYWSRAVGEGNIVYRFTCTKVSENFVAGDENTGDQIRRKIRRDATNSVDYINVNDWSKSCVYRADRHEQ